MIQELIAGSCIVAFLFIIWIWWRLIFNDESEPEVDRSFTFYTPHGQPIQWQVFTNDKYIVEQEGEQPEKKVM
ncbi:hypothetical protein FVR03_06730 [Pontibacter qinzhouensis]|uniref:Uncharacterized protein n=1 Tax=Pontibacter qinzhouensis TaxID=2603253 RepID=A0A5C8KAJ1_9BACT|nr:hypothetical protein [Pontibacter qinzhouensis]TXK49255.1 hypothetical protein FVR03_06730 [Pontibacter qinzhouensis]